MISFAKHLKLTALGQFALGFGSFTFLLARPAAAQNVPTVEVSGGYSLLG